MNHRMVLKTTGKITLLGAAILLIPMLVSLIFQEWLQLFSFLGTAVIAALLGLALVFFSRPKKTEIFVREGFVTVALAWVVLSLIGALPFVFSNEIPSYIDALFETVSGFTTTGASIIKNVETLSHGMLLWRSLTHWVGGMGVLVLMMAIAPNESGRSMHIMRAEMPGPIVGKLVPKVRDTAKILYLIYIGMTVLEAILLCFGEMSVFESVVHSLSTAGTGGFGIKNDSLAGYSTYSQWVITVFMLLFGVNFNLYYLLLIKRFRSIAKSGELKAYLGIVVGATALICINIYSTCSGFFEALRQSALQVASVITTTGFTTADFGAWPDFSKTILVLLMFIGGCAGSTAGGFKISRVMLVFKMIKNNLRKMLHPRAVSRVRHEGETVDSQTLSEVNAYFMMYIVILAISILLIGFEPFGFENTFITAVSCFNNIGIVSFSPTSHLPDYSVLSKLVLTLMMLVGRLEIYPMLFLLSPTTWTKK